MCSFFFVDLSLYWVKFCSLSILLSKHFLQCMVLKIRESNSYMVINYIWTFLTLIHHSKNLFFIFMEKNYQILPLVFVWTFPSLLFHPSPSFHIYICFSFPGKGSNQEARLPVSKDLLSVWGRGRILGWYVPRLAFSGSATLETTVKHNVILTNDLGKSH